jgi:DNA-binding transcriptional LysR family regulator
MRLATLRQLRAFTLVAQHHSFKQAAAALHLTPAAVSLQIRELELAAGLQLFDRHSATLRLTQAGEVLMADVRPALQALQRAGDALAQLRCQKPTILTVGMASSAKYFLPRLMAQFRELHPDVLLQIVVGNRDHLVGLLQRGEVDLAVMGSLPDGLDCRAQAFAEQPLGVVAAPEHPLARARAVPPQELSHCEFILREPGSGTRAAHEEFLRSLNIDLPLRREVAGNDAVKQAVMANLGLAFMSLHAAALELQSGLLASVDVVSLPLMRPWYVIEAVHSPLSDRAQALRNFILERGISGSVLARGVSARAA